MEGVQIRVPERAAEINRLVRTSLSADDQDDREAARIKLRELAAEWRGFPGQRRRGELPAGVEVR